MMETTKIKWRRKDCLGLRGVSREEIELVLDTARSMKENPYAHREEGSPVARKSGRLSVLRAQHSHSHLLRIGSHPFVGGCDSDIHLDQQRRQGRNLD
jgi:hypothetical protein